jgi:hypothetical protein
MTSSMVMMPTDSAPGSTMLGWRSCRSSRLCARSQNRQCPAVRRLPQEWPLCTEHGSPGMHHAAATARRQGLYSVRCDRLLACSDGAGGVPEVNAPPARATARTGRPRRAPPHARPARRWAQARPAAPSCLLARIKATMMLCACERMQAACSRVLKEHPLALHVQLTR